MNHVFVIVCTLFFLHAGAQVTASDATETATADRGKALFNDAALGTSGKTCNGCHPGGKGLENAGTRKDLVRMVNICITGPLKGKDLQTDSVEMQSLILYINSLGEKKPAKKKAPVGC